MVEPTHIIVCHTRDRPEHLAATLLRVAEHLALGSGFPRPVVLLIDDSTTGDHQRANRSVLEDLFGEFSEYFGAAEYAVLLSGCREKLGAGAADLERFVRPLGDAAWDPGAARNAAFLAILRRRPVPDVIVTLDDDILVPSAAHDCLGELAGLVKRDPEMVCSATLIGQPDASLFFRALAVLGSVPDGRSEPPVPVCTGLIAFHSRWVRSFPFPRCYSEDWIWSLTLAAAGATLRRLPLLAVHTGERRLVLDLAVLRRECLGEALVSGFRRLPAGSGSELGENCPLRSRSLWEGVLAEEVGDTEELAGGVNGTGTAGQILEVTLRLLRALEPEEARSFACTYLDGLPVWRELARRLAGSGTGT